MKIFGKPLENLFKSEKTVGKEKFLKPVKTVKDLEDFYDEFGTTRWADDMASKAEIAKFLENNQVVTDDSEQEDDNYWQGIGDPQSIGRGMTDYERAENVAAEEDMDMAAIDDIDLGDIVGKTRWKKGPEVDDSIESVLEVTDRPYVARENLEPKDLERQKKQEALYQEIKRNPKGVKKTEEAENVVVQPARVKPEVKIEVEKKEKPIEKPMSALDKFKLMKNVMAYNILVANNPDLEKLRPTRGDTPLSMDQIAAEVKAFRAKKEFGTEAISQSEQDFFKQCQAWVDVARRVEQYKGNEPKNADGKILSKEERETLQNEYFALKGDEKKFAQLTTLLNFEDIGNKKVESGEWKKGEFAWQEEKGLNGKGSRWYCSKDKDLYYTYGDPSSILDNNKSAEFFYVVNKEEPYVKGKKIYISIKIPKQEKVLA